MIVIVLNKVYTNAISDAGGFYNSWSGYEDELMWSAAWMALATGLSFFWQKVSFVYMVNIVIDVVSRMDGSGHRFELFDREFC